MWTKESVKKEYKKSGTEIFANVCIVSDVYCGEISINKIELLFDTFEEAKSYYINHENYSYFDNDCYSKIYDKDFILLGEVL